MPQKSLVLRGMILEVLAENYYRSYTLEEFSEIIIPDSDAVTFSER